MRVRPDNLRAFRAAHGVAKGCGWFLKLAVRVNKKRKLIYGEMDLAGSINVGTPALTGLDVKDGDVIELRAVRDKVPIPAEVEPALGSAMDHAATVEWVWRRLDRLKERLLRDELGAEEAQFDGPQASVYHVFAECEQDAETRLERFDAFISLDSEGHLDTRPDRPLLVRLEWDGAEYFGGIELDALGDTGVEARQHQILCFSDEDDRDLMTDLPHGLVWGKKSFTIWGDGVEWTYVIRGISRR